MSARSDVKISDFERVVFFTGAGMSVESGIPTYRGEGGVWEQYNYEDYACQDAFDRDPERVWDFHDKRREFIGSCAPNAGHELIAGWQKKRPGISIVTQNIDGLHQRAGSPDPFELHGSIWRVRCDHCGVVVTNTEQPLAERKHGCGHYWRPDIVWFGDPLKTDVIEGALKALESAQLLVSIGTSGVVYPAAQFPLIAKRAGATLVEINPQPSALSEAFDVCLRGPSTEMLPTLA